MSRMRLLSHCLILPLALVLSDSTRAQGKARLLEAEQIADRCVTGSAILPLLGGPSDAPIIPVTINDHPAAMFVSPLFGHLFVHNAGDIWFNQGITHPMIAQDYVPVLSEQTKIDTLQIGPIMLHDLIAERLDGEARHSISDRPLIGMIGRPLFKKLLLMLDVPHEKLGLMIWRNSPDCSSGPSAIFTRTPQILAMDDRARVMAQIDGRKLRLTLDPDLGMNTLPVSDPANSASTGDLAHDPQVVTRFGAITRGARHVFHSFRLGEKQLGPTEFLVLENIDEGTLGESFFQHNVVLFDFPDGQFLFAPSEPRVFQPNLGLHFDETHQGYTSVKESGASAAGKEAN
ncbi:hypothetical protein [Asaia sp. HN010]|uniref:hypothetical protein n=1 Tax=Asaia sp. HN010 TaxID=3081233 RepID=UPI00301B306B